MDCASSLLPDAEWLARLDGAVADARVPLSGSVELTRRCNLDCVHCYAGGKVRRASGPGMDTDFWRRTLDALAEAGCLYLLFTGGEPLLRPDFAELYEHARLLGMVTTVFTNATLVTDDLAARFRDLPPHVVEVSVYAASPETSRAVCGDPRAAHMCRRGIETLLAHGVRVRAKSMLLRANRHEMDAVRDMAAEYGLEFRLDAALMPRLDGDPAPLAQRVPPEQAVARELDDPRRLVQWREFFAGMHGSPVLEALYNCGAGTTEFHVCPDGTVRPCLMVDRPAFNLREMPFEQGWREVIPAVRDMAAPADFACARCEKVFACDFCPAFFRLETGSEIRRSEYVCAMAQLRYAAIRGGEE